MGDEERFERISPTRRGDEILRRRIRRRARPRLRREIPNTLYALQVIFTETPLVRIMLMLMALVAIFAALLFITERGSNPNFDNYGTAVWWLISSMQTQGNAFRPITFWGSVVGGAWAVLGTFIFWGAIIASITYYFLQRRKHTRREILRAIKYSFDELEELSLEELELLKESTDNVISKQIQEVKAKGTDRDKQ